MRPAWLLLAFLAPLPASSAPAGLESLAGTWVGVANCRKAQAYDVRVELVGEKGEFSSVIHFGPAGRGGTLGLPAQWITAVGPHFYFGSDFWTRWALSALKSAGDQGARGVTLKFDPKASKDGRLSYIWRSDPYGVPASGVLYQWGPGPKSKYKPAKGTTWWQYGAMGKAQGFDVNGNIEVSPDGKLIRAGFEAHGKPLMKVPGCRDFSCSEGCAAVLTREERTAPVSAPTEDAPPDAPVPLLEE